MMNNNNKKIGIMGGTFDPPHLGHLLCAECVAAELELERVIFVPTGNFLYKDNSETSAAADRLEMTRLAIAGNHLFEICDVESANQGYSYTCYTLEKLSEMYTDADIYFIVGADSLDYMERWRNPQRIFELASVVAVNREGYTAEDCKEKAHQLQDEFGADIRFVFMPEIDLSSSEIRQRVANKKSIKYMVPDLVADYIYEKNLYFKY